MLSELYDKLNKVYVILGWVFDMRWLVKFYLMI